MSLTINIDSDAEDHDSAAALGEARTAGQALANLLRGNVQLSYSPPIVPYTPYPGAQTEDIAPNGLALVLKEESGLTDKDRIVAIKVLSQR